MNRLKRSLRSLISQTQVGGSLGIFFTRESTWRLSRLCPLSLSQTDLFLFSPWKNVFPLHEFKENKNKRESKSKWRRMEKQDKYYASRRTTAGDGGTDGRDGSHIISLPPLTTTRLFFNGFERLDRLQTERKNIVINLSPPTLWPVAHFFSWLTNVWGAQEWSERLKTFSPPREEEEEEAHPKTNVVE